MLAPLVLLLTLPCAAASVDLDDAFQSSRVRIEFLRQFGYLGTSDATPTAINVFTEKKLAEEAEGGEFDEVAFVPRFISGT